ncbi:MAG: hypothetical protein IT385_11200 [Deltaproteobacteria bacterium]|nr:hypothetical protein [Deltaproteobacteria bacterium]
MRARLALVALLVSPVPVALGALVAPAALAQPAPTPAATVDVALQALGGATVKVPATWKEIKTEAALAVREQAPDPAAQAPFFVLLCAIEEGPPVGAADGPAPGVPWLKVRDNIVEAASRGDRKLTLAVGDPFKDAVGFEGRRLRGELETSPPAGAPAGGAPKKLVIELVALVKNERLLTIGLLAEPSAAAAARDAVATIAGSARLGP